MQNKEYIERGAFRQKLIDRQITTQFFNNRERYEIGCIIEMLDNAPAADVVEVVRCKWCKHSTWSQEPCHGKVEYHCKLHGLAVDKHFYCASGERREHT